MPKSITAKYRDT